MSAVSRSESGRCGIKQIQSEQVSFKSEVIDLVLLFSFIFSRRLTLEIQYMILDGLQKHWECWSAMIQSGQAFPTA